ncbi:MAG: hypothetical protein ACYC5M_02610 [Anaerolineae bacterium]
MRNPRSRAGEGTAPCVTHQPGDSAKAIAALWWDCVRLTRPRVLALLLLTTLAALCVAAGGLSPLPMMLYTMLGSYLPAGRLAPPPALAFGVALSGPSCVVFWRGVNLLAAARPVRSLRWRAGPR